MKKLIIALVFAMACSSFAISQIIPKIGIASSLANDSVLFASGYTMLGESVARMVSPNLSEEQFNKNRALVKAAKCQVYMCNSFFPAEIKIAGNNIDEQKVIDFAAVVFKRASQLGVKAIVLGSGKARMLENGVDKKEAEFAFIKLGKALSLLAEQYNVLVFLENLNTTETNFINSVAEGAHIVRQINHPNFRLNADIYHMLKDNESPQSIIDAADVIAYCEIAEKDERTPPGTKGDDFLPYLKALAQISYNGHIFIEGRWKDLLIEAPKAKKYLEKQLNIAYAN